MRGFHHGCFPPLDMPNSRLRRSKTSGPQVESFRTNRLPPNSVKLDPILIPMGIVCWLDSSPKHNSSSSVRGRSTRIWYVGCFDKERGSQKDKVQPRRHYRHLCRYRKTPSKSPHWPIYSYGAFLHRLNYCSTTQKVVNLERP
jgi:hypothetical protein